MEQFEDKQLEKRLRKMAKARAEFKQHLLTYIVINGLLWAINYLTQMGDRSIYWWAIWPTLGWGVGLVLHFFTSYTGLSEESMAQREYERLRRKYDR
jgi:hypothetical protein